MLSLAEFSAQIRARTEELAKTRARRRRQVTGAFVGLACMGAVGILAVTLDGAVQMAVVSNELNTQSSTITGSYALVAVVTFTAGVVVTLIFRPTHKAHNQAHEGAEP